MNDKDVAYVYHRTVVVVQSLRHVPLLATPCTLPSSLLCPWNYPGKNTPVGYHFLFHGIFLTYGLNPRLLIDYLPLSHQKTFGILLSNKKKKILPFAKTWKV